MADEYDDNEYRTYHGGFDITPDLSRARVNFREDGFLRGTFVDREVPIEIDGERDLAHVSRLAGFAPPEYDRIEVPEIAGLADELQGLVAQIPDGHAVTGSLFSEGAEEGDIEKFTVNGREIQRERPRWMWSDGSEVQRYDGRSH